MVNLTASQVKLTYVNEVPKKERIKITGPESVYNLLLQEVYDKETIEHHMSVNLILFNRTMHLLGVYPLADGGIHESTLDIRMIFQAALLSNSSGFILARNSPSCGTEPSKEDLAASNKLQEASRIMRFDYADYLIISPDGYLSLADQLYIIGNSNDSLTIR